MEQNPKEKEIITQLDIGRKTWTELEQNLTMSSKTLYKTLMKLMEKGTVIKYGTVEFEKIVDYYDLAKKRKPTIALKVPRMFEKSEFFSFPVIKNDLDVEQSLVQWFCHSLKVIMHFARKTLNVRFAEELSPITRIEYTDNWKSEAVEYASEWMDGFIEWIIQGSDASWIEIFGSYEDDPKPFLQAMVKFSEMIDEGKKKSDRN